MIIMIIMIIINQIRVKVILVGEREYNFTIFF